MAKSLNILDNLPDEDLVWLREAGRLRQLSVGEPIITAGATPDELLVLLAGNLAVVTGDGRSVAQIAAGEVIGEMSFIENEPPRANVVASSGGRLLAIPHAALLSEFESNAAFAARFYRALATFLSARLRATTTGQQDEDAVADSTRSSRAIHLLGGEQRASARADRS